MPSLKIIQISFSPSLSRPTHFQQPRLRTAPRSKETAPMPTQTIWWISKLLINAYLISTPLSLELVQSPDSAMKNFRSTAIALRSSGSRRLTSRFRRQLPISQPLKAKRRLVWYSVTTRSKASTPILSRKWSLRMLWATTSPMTRRSQLLTLLLRKIKLFHSNTSLSTITCPRGEHRLSRTTLKC